MKTGTAILPHVYVTSVEGYNALVQDTNFMTVDKIGDKATLLRGQVGAILGYPSYH